MFYPLFTCNPTYFNRQYFPLFLFRNKTLYKLVAENLIVYGKLSLIPTWLYNIMQQYTINL